MNKILEMTPEDKQLFKPLASAEAQEFLQARLRVVEANIKRQHLNLERSGTERTELVRGAEALLEAYEQEKAIIEELKAASQEALFPNVIHSSLEAARRQRTQWHGMHTVNHGENPKIKRAKREIQILNELLRQWLNRLKTEE